MEYARAERRCVYPKIFASRHASWPTVNYLEHVRRRSRYEWYIYIFFGACRVCFAISVSECDLPSWPSSTWRSYLRAHARIHVYPAVDYTMDCWAFTYPQRVQPRSHLLMKIYSTVRPEETHRRCQIIRARVAREPPVPVPRARTSSPTVSRSRDPTWATSISRMRPCVRT